ncbi:Uncharacterised protein [Yersinia massiliensis]|uniref:hypothetical protein n=1 Tax=Yersinia massiliensis TaxID=419257 RepID=UPI0005DEA8FE|nr:hypothetical protein [Yersinia massiliensis]CNH66691.1 Uncharacterised protein [Yersinia massiliensis]
MILFIDGNQIDDQHSSINRSMIKVFELIYPNEEFSVLCEKSHYTKIVDNTADKHSINYASGLYIAGPNSKLKKFFSEIYNFLFIICYIIFNNPKKVVFLSLYPTSHYLYRRISNFLKPEIYVVCHGELRFIRNNTNSLLTPCGWMIKAFSFSTNKIKSKWCYIYLGEQIEIPIFMQNENIVKINLPTEFKAIPPKRKLINKTCITLATIGVASESKMTHLFFEMAMKLKSNKKIRFIATGAVDHTIMKYKDSNVDADYSGQFLPSKEVEKRLNSADLAVFFYNDAYADVASGAVLEAIRYEIPVLALNNKYFQFLEKNNIKFFKCFENIDEMEEFILSDGYYDINCDFSSAKKLYSIEAAAKILNASIHNLHSENSNKSYG